MTEETLDRNYFIVINKETGESGKVSKEFVSVGEFWPLLQGLFVYLEFLKVQTLAYLSFLNDSIISITTGM